MKKSIIILFIFAVLGIGLYWNSLDNIFLHDDDEVIVHNQGIKKLEDIPLIFIDPRLSTSNPIFAGHYRPFVTVSYAIDYAIGGLNPVGYHLVNLAFHVGTAFLIFLIVKAMLDNSEQLAVSSKQLEVKSAYSSQLTANYLAPLAAGLIFLVHPFNSEAVNYATARSSVMSGFFYLLAFWAWIKFRSTKSDVRENLTSNLLLLTSDFLPLTSYFYLVSLLAFTAGMLSKEIVITLPIVLWLYDRWGGKKGYLTYIPFVVVIAAYMGIRHVLFAGMIPHFQRDLWTQFLTELPVLAGHWWLFLWPKNLTLIHYIEIYRSITLPVVISFVFLTLYIVVAVYLWLKGQQWGRLISFFMVWFFVVLLPSSIIPLNTIFQENRGYLSIVSFVVLSGVVLGEISRRFASDNRISKPVAAFLVVLLIVYSVATVKRNIVWGDSLLFWQDAVAKSPKSGNAYTGLSMAYRMQGNMFLAIEAAKKGLQAEPKNLFLFFNIARSYYRMGEMDKAVYYYNRALFLGLNQRFLWEEVAFVLIKKGDLKLAGRYLNQALKIWPDSAKLHLYTGLTQKGGGHLEDSVKSFRKAIALHPGYILAVYRLAETIEVMGQSAESMKWYGEVVRLAAINIDLSDLPYGQDREALERLIEEARKKVNQKGQG